MKFIKVPQIKIPKPDTPERHLGIYGQQNHRVFEIRRPKNQTKAKDSDPT